MRITQTFSAVLRLFRTVILIDACIFLAVGLLCFFAGWRTLYQYGDALVKAGVVILVIVLLTGLGGNSARVEDIAAYSRSGAMRSDEFLLRSYRESDTRSRFILVGFFATGISIIAGSVLLTMP